MGDSGEGLVDADSRIQERMEQLAADKRQRAAGQKPIDPERARELQSLKLARADLQQQVESAAHPVRKQQLQLAMEAIEKRLAELG